MNTAVARLVDPSLPAPVSKQGKQERAVRTVKLYLDRESNERLLALSALLEANQSAVMRAALAHYATSFDTNSLLDLSVDSFESVAAERW